MGLIAPALMLGVLAVPSLQVPAHAAGDCTVSSTLLSASQEEQNLLNTINSMRSQPFQWSNTLSRAAVWMAQDAAARGDGTSHVDSLGRDVRARATDCGYPASLPVGENIAAGPWYLWGDLNTYGALTMTTADWQNLTSTTYTHVGIGYVTDNNTQLKNYWVVVVGLDSNAPAPTPTVKSKRNRGS